MSSWSHWFWVTTFLFGYFLIQHLQAESLQVEPVERDELSLQNVGGKLHDSTEKTLGDVWRRAKGGFPVTIPTNSLRAGVSNVSVSHSVSRVSVRMGPITAVRPKNFKHNPKTQLRQKVDINTGPNRNNKKSAVEIEKKPKDTEIQSPKIILYRSENVVREPVSLDKKGIENHSPVEANLNVIDKVDKHEEIKYKTFEPIVNIQSNNKQKVDIRFNHSNLVVDEGSEEERDDMEITSQDNKIQRLSSVRQLSLETLDMLKSLAHVSTAGKEKNLPTETQSKDVSSREGKAIRPSLIQVKPEDIAISRSEVSLPEKRRPSHHNKVPLREVPTGSHEIKEGIIARRMYPDGDPLRPMNEDNDQSPALSLLNQRAHKQIAEQKNVIDEVEADDGTNYSIMDMIKAWTDSVLTTKSQMRKQDKEQERDILMDELNKAEKKDTANNTERKLIAETVQTFRNPSGRTERINRDVKQFIEELKKSIEERNRNLPNNAGSGLPFSGTGRSLPDVNIWNHGFRQGTEHSLLSDFKSLSTHDGMPQVLNPRDFINEPVDRDFTLDLETSGFSQELDIGDYTQDLDTRDFIQDLEASSSEVHYMAAKDIKYIEKSEFMMGVAGEAVKTRLMDVTNIVALTLGTIVFVISVSVGAGVMFYRKQYYLKPDALEDTYSHSDCASCNYTDTEVFQTVSYGDCVGIEMAKENLPEDLNTLDNDSFLNSLEVMVMPEYWNDSVRL